MHETLVRVKKLRNGWGVECWGLQHALAFSQERAVDLAAAVVWSLRKQGEAARVVVEDPLG